MAEDSKTSSSPAATPKRRPWWLTLIVVCVIVAAAVHEVGVKGRRARYAWLRVPQERVQPSGKWRLAETVPAQAGELAGCNVLLVTLDTTRAGRLGCYGNSGIDTPVLDGLARRGVLFSNAVAPAPTTLPSHASILTGVYPVHHGARTNGMFRMGDAQHTLAEMLSPAGYATGAVVSAFVLDSRFGLAQGFGFYDDDVSAERGASPLGAEERRADRTTARAIAWLDQAREGPFFLWVHYFDPHAVYQPPAAFAEQYPYNLYDGEIAFVDQQLGRLLGEMEQRGLLDETLVVVAGDHGEGLGEHDEHTHGYLVYDVTQRVPLIMNCGRRWGEGVHVSRRVSLVDIVPTVLSLLGIGAPGGLDGLDLTQPAPADRRVYVETYHGFMENGWAALLGVYEGDHKYIHGPHPELFDLADDPFEHRNLVAAEADRVEHLVSKLTDLFGAEVVSDQAPRPTSTLSPDELAKLESLGYAFSGASETSAGGPRPDPRERIDLVNRIFEIVCFYQPRGLHDRAIELLEELTREYPEAYPAHYNLGSAYVQAGRLADAVDAYERCVTLRPRAAEALYNLATTLIGQGEHSEAEVQLRRLLSGFPNHFEGHYDLAHLLAGQHRFSAAADQIKLAFELDPSSDGCAAFLVRVFVAAELDAELERILRGQLRAHPRQTRVRNALADHLASQQRFGESGDLLREGAILTPDDGEAVSALAWLLASCPGEAYRQPDEGLAIMERFVDTRGGADAHSLFTLARIHDRLGHRARAVEVAQQALDVARDTGRDDLAQSVSTFLARLDS
ncbi:MAG: sulfatase-like hydrolase/transferase [bacterium]|nr:sulfatase-like hydrolase/transferase [bacterium]